MLDFFKDKTKRKAFKQALYEVEQEEAVTPARSVAKAHTKDTSISRVYQSTAQEEITQGELSYKIKNPLRRPETTAIDLKHFKDWRKVDKVESKQPKYIDKKPAFIFSDEDDEWDEPKKTIPGEFIKPNPDVEPVAGDSATAVDLAERIYASPLKAKTKDLNSASYLKEKGKEEFAKKSLKDMLAAVAPDSAKKYEEEKMKKLEEEKKLAEEKKKERELARLKKEEEFKETKIKVEVVDFKKEEKKPEPVKVEPEKPKEPKKPAAPRKPRGKSKKRYDADVISSVNWKKTTKK